MPRTVIDAGKIDSLSDMIRREIEAIKDLLTGIEKAVEIYNEESAVKIYKELFEAIKNLVKAEKGFSESKDSLSVDEKARILEDLYDNFRKMAPRMPLYFSKNLDKDIKLVKETLAGKITSVQKYRIISQKSFYKHIESSIRDYSSYFMLVDRFSDHETALAKEYLKSNNDHGAKNALIRKKRYQKAMIPFLWQKLNLEKLLTGTGAVSALDLLQEAKKNGRIPPSQMTMLKAFFKSLDVRRESIKDLKVKYSNSDEVVNNLENYERFYQKLSENFKSVIG